MTRNVEKSVWDEIIGPFYREEQLPYRIALQDGETLIELETPDGQKVYPTRQFDTRNHPPSVNPNVGRAWEILQPTAEKIGSWTVAGFLFDAQQTRNVNGLSLAEILATSEPSSGAAKHGLEMVTGYVKRFEH